MKSIKVRFITLCGLMVLAAAALAPVVSYANCPAIEVQCSNGSERLCQGNSDGAGHCLYNESCINC
jgi:hypothetical protein